MPGFNGTGPRGIGPMTGSGRGFCSIPLPGNWPAAPGTMPFAPQMTREQELDFLKNQPSSSHERTTGANRGRNSAVEK